MALTISNNTIFDPSSFDMWDPFQACPFLADLTRPFFAHRNDSTTSSAFSTPRVDWKETPEAHVFKADLPGLRKDEVKVEVEEGRVLKISGERIAEKEEKSDKWHCLERGVGKFLRRFRLPENANVDEVKAEMENGVLTVTVAKVEEKKPQVKVIDIVG